jgi:hypothetical protein
MNSRSAIAAAKIVSASSGCSATSRHSATMNQNQSRIRPGRDRENRVVLRFISRYFRAISETTRSDGIGVGAGTRVLVKRRLRS